MYLSIYKNTPYGYLYRIIIPIFYDTSILKLDKMFNIYSSKINGELELKEKRVILVKEKVRIMSRKECEKHKRRSLSC